MNTEVITNIEEAFEELGVTPSTLNNNQKKALDEQGYIILPGIIDRTWLEQLRQAFEQASQRAKGDAALQTRPETGTRHVSLIINENPALERILTQPKVLAAAYHVLQRDFQVQQFGGRDPLPGYGQQGLHADWLPRQPGQPFSAVNSLWMLDDFTVETGATRLVAGTHLLTTKPSKNMMQPGSTHPNQIQAIAPAGSVLVFNAHLWHSGMQNRSKNHRRVINCFFLGRELRLFAGLPTPNLTGLSPAARYLVGE